MIKVDQRLTFEEKGERVKGTRRGKEKGKKEQEEKGRKRKGNKERKEKEKKEQEEKGRKRLRKQVSK